MKKPVLNKKQAMMSQKISSRISILKDNNTQLKNRDDYQPFSQINQAMRCLIDLKISESCQIL